MKPRRLGRALTALALAAAVAQGCGTAPEYLLLERFFAASRLRDRTALSRFATVVFEPHVNGTVSSFSVASVSPARAVEIAGGGPAEALAPTESRRIADLSLADPLEPVAGPSGATRMEARDVIVEAAVRLPDGSNSARRIVVTLQRAVDQGAAAGRGRWIVTGFR